ncbi:MAG: type II secretion system F family protein [Candidatus Micrarchaeota archaeon]|nr:type II secretion system F family protein [Candidatus Micrarchaeota archaeon]
MFDRLFVLVSLAFPKRIVDLVRELLVQSDFDMNVREYLGVSAVMAFAVGLIMFFISATFVGNILGFLVSIFAMLVIEAVFFVFLYITADNRAKKIEEVLPDALFMISANIRAGMTTENAIMVSAKPEFGPLEEEIRRMSTKTFSGVSLNEALTEMANRVRSNTLKRAVRLLVEGNSLGGQMANLLYEVGQDMRNIMALRRELMNMTLMYTIFIVFSCVFAAPALFATSVYYTQLSAKLTEGVSVDTSSMPAGASSFTGFLSSGPRTAAITGDEMQLFAIVCIFVTTFFSSLVLSEIRHGRLNAAIKYVPVFVVVAYTVFFGATFLLTTMFKSMLAI